jgi:aminopeptidase N
VRSKALVVALVLLAVAVVGGGIWLVRDRGSADPGDPPGAANAGLDVEPTVDPDDPELEVSLSEPVEDSYYPEVGDPGVDALHYDLDLTWLPDDQTLQATEALVFRATEDADSFQLDLGEALTVDDIEVDGEPVRAEHDGKDLVVDHPVRADERYTVTLAYSGTPEPTPAPTDREDFSASGWTITDSNAVWTMQEPFGAFTWYAVNDQPADKALYDFTLRVPAPWTGVANGTMTARDEVDGETVTTFELVEPASSYLTTVAFGDYDLHTDETAGGTPLNYWLLSSQSSALPRLQFAGRAVTWAERWLGPYPFSSAGVLLTDSESGMETQTLITLGDSSYVTSRETLVHEMVHQWYGDLVTPTDWRDVWMNEGMAMYLQLVYRAQVEERSIDEVMDEYAEYDQPLRDLAGPPGEYKPQSFGQANIYYCPALMWHELRQQVGDREFRRLVREWPQANAFGNATRQEWFDWLEAETGRELTAFFDAWIVGDTTPQR